MGFLPSLRRAAGIGVLGVHHFGAQRAQELLSRWPRIPFRRARPALTGPERLKAFFEDAGGAFIKLGQLLALQPDILPLDYCNELYDLLDRVDPCSYEEIERIFTAEIGRSPDEVFDSFDREPLSTASIGQVHVAYRDGHKLAVKVRRAGADAEFAEDIRLMDGLMRLLDLLRLERFYWLKSPITEFIDWTSEELDYRQEARYMEEIRRNAENNPHAHIPAVDWELTTRRTLVVEFCDGPTVLGYLRAIGAGEGDLPHELESKGFHPPTFARNIVDNFLRDAFVHGLFHADLHPANLLILPENVVGYIDFGITGALSGYTTRRLASLTIAWSLGDLDQIREAFFQLTEAPTDEQKRAYRSGLEELARDWYETIDGRRRLTRSFTLVMLEMLGLSHRTGIMPDREVTKYLRSAIASDGLVKRFAPGFDVADELEAGCRRYLKSRLLKDLFSFENVASWSSLVDKMLRRGTFSPRPPEAATEEAPQPTRGGRGADRNRTLQLALVSVGFAALGAVTAGEIGPVPGLLTAELGISLAAGLLLLRSLARSR